MRNYEMKLSTNVGPGETINAVEPKTLGKDRRVISVYRNNQQNVVRFSYLGERDEGSATEPVMHIEFAYGEKVPVTMPAHVKGK